MLKKMLVAAMAVMALAAVAAPTASATWTHNHVALGGGENPEETLTGTFQFQGLIGKVHCSNMELRLQLLGGQTTATVKVFQSQNPAACHASGAFGTSCGTNSLQKTELQTHATGHIVTHNGLPAVTVTHLKLLSTFGSCTTTFLESDATRDILIVPSDPTTIGTATLTGTLKTPAGGVAVSGTFHPHIPNTYGIVVH
jgi:hypothetical protein